MAGYTYYGPLQQTWWTSFSLPFIFFDYYSPAAPPYPGFPPLTPFFFNFGFFYNGIWYPPLIRYNWTSLNVAPAYPGWWLSINNDFNGAALVVAQTTPHNPRSFDEISSFASGSSGMLGGFPGPCCVWKNRLVYAEGLYTVGTNPPPIDIFDGAFNHTVTLVPSTSAGVIPKSVMTMLSANGVVYFTTLDSGTSSANYSGRVFSLNIETGQVIQLGVASDFPTGDVPYALAWFMGKLWCGTNRADGTAANVFWIRPGVDTNWTNDLSLATQSQGGVASMVQYNGNLYVGTTAAAATFAKVLKRDTSGNWTTSDTGSGGAATTNNGYLALAVFGTNLYASYWNGDTPKVSKIRRFDNSSWTTVYTGTGVTNIPFVGFPTDPNVTPVLLAIGGGLGYQAALITTTNGTAWSDQTVFLTQGSPVTTGLPVFGVVIQ